VSTYIQPRNDEKTFICEGKHRTRSVFYFIPYLGDVLNALFLQFYRRGDFEAVGERIARSPTNTHGGSMRYNKTLKAGLLISVTVSLAACETGGSALEGTGELVVGVLEIATAALDDRPYTPRQAATAYSPTSTVTPRVLNYERPKVTKHLEDFLIRADDPVLGSEIFVDVWDHDCEDGDEIRVSLVGVGFEDFQLTKTKQTRRLGYVSPGRDAVVEITALNGTGYLGSCNHANVNTGAIVVRDNDNSVRRNWQMEAQAGTRSRIVIN